MYLPHPFDRWRILVAPPDTCRSKVVGEVAGHRGSERRHVDPARFPGERRRRTDASGTVGAESGARPLRLSGLLCEDRQALRGQVAGPKRPAGGQHEPRIAR